MDNKEKLEQMKQIRIGERKNMNCGLIAEIVEYNNCGDIVIKFLETNEMINTNYSNFKSKKVKSRQIPSICGVGIVDLERTVDKNGIRFDSYIRWKSMLQRCYNKKIEESIPTYKNITVCKEWHNYSNFKKWYDENYYEIDGEKMHLDKDILFKGNKIYSPDTCVFVPQTINCLFTKRGLDRGKYPIGVVFSKESNKYKANLNNRNKRVYIGAFDTPEESFNAYKEAKEQYIKEVADEYKDKIPKKLYDAMYKWEVEITD